MLSRNNSTIEEAAAAEQRCEVLSEENATLLRELGNYKTRDAVLLTLLRPISETVHIVRGIVGDQTACVRGLRARHERGQTERLSVLARAHQGGIYRNPFLHTSQGTRFFSSQGTRFSVLPRNPIFKPPVWIQQIQRLASVSPSARAL